MDDINLHSEDWERFVEPKFRTVHKGVRLEPETVWDELRKLLCGRPWRRSDVDIRSDLVADLMFWHADVFIDRVEALAADCRHARHVIALAEVGGRTETPGLTRYWALQESLRRGWKQRS